MKCTPKKPCATHHIRGCEECAPKKPRICRMCETFGDGPCSPRCIDSMKEKMARAIHRERNRHEGIETPWIVLHEFQREKYRCYAYAALRSQGVPARLLKGKP